MSNFLQNTVHPETGVTELAEWLDDYFGRHRYGVRFADGKVFPEKQCSGEGDEKDGTAPKRTS